MDSKRIFAFVIGTGIFLMMIAFAIGAATGVYTPERTVVGLLGVGFVLTLGGAVVWLVVEKPVVDPYEEPPPDYGDH